jgi:hypothetical protein
MHVRALPLLLAFAVALASVACGGRALSDGADASSSTGGDAAFDAAFDVAVDVVADRGTDARAACAVTVSVGCPQAGSKPPPPCCFEVTGACGAQPFFARGSCSPNSDGGGSFAVECSPEGVAFGGYPGDCDCSDQDAIAAAAENACRVPSVPGSGGDE